MMSGENDEANEACDRARAYYGLPPLYKDMLFHTSTEAATDDAFRVQFVMNLTLQNSRRVHVYHGRIRLP